MSTMPYGVRRDLSQRAPRPQVGIQRHTGVGFELVLDPVVPQMAEQLVEVVAPVPAPAVFHASSSVVEYIAPAPAVLQAPTPVVEYVAPAPSVVQAPSLVVQYSSPVPAVFPTPVVEIIAPAPQGLQAPSPVVESIAPSPVVQASLPVVENIAPAPVVQAPGWVFVTCASCVSCWRSSRGQSSTSRRPHDLLLPSGWRRADDASGRVNYWHVNTRQTRWTPPVSVDLDEDVEDEECEEEDEDEEDEGHGRGLWD